MGCPSDAALADYLSGALAPPERDAFDQHLDACAGCQELLGALGRQNEAREPQRGEQLGRYFVLERLGEGAMGAVYAAYDPELDRRVALKLLRGTAEDSERAQARLLREARAMARLAHPNVVPVFDVGAAHGEVFVAMELVRGGTVSQRLAAAERPPRAQVLEWFLCAGEGLAAAHAAGLVHREFKPENILVGEEDGRARVSDFGLASPAPVEADGGTGTPAYMSPEQLRGDPATAQSDQYSFCVALVEALSGARPFEGESLKALADARQAGPSREAMARLSRPLASLLERGLAPEPADRFPSMRALLDALSGARSWRRRALAAAALAALIAAAGVGRAVWEHRRAAQCAPNPSALAGVWDEALRSRLGTADASAGVLRTLDAYAASWVQLQSAACAATRLRGEATERVLEQRTQCLHKRRQELRSLTALITLTDPVQLQRGAQASAGLTPVSSCWEPAGLRVQVEPPASALAPEVEVRRQALARAHALVELGRYEEAVALAAEEVKHARAVGYRPLVAEALYAEGRARTFMQKEPAEAARDLFEAATLAQSVGDDELATEGWLTRVFALGVLEAKYDAALENAALARAALERLGGSPALSARLATHLAQVHVLEERYPEAIKRCEEAIRFFEQSHGPNASALRTPLSALSRALFRQGRFEESRRVAQRLYQLTEATLGPRHPLLSDALDKLAGAEWALGNIAPAVEHYERALQLLLELRGPDSAQTGNAYFNAGTALMSAGEAARAAEYFQRTRDIYLRVLPSGHPNHANSLAALGVALMNLGRVREGEARIREALELERALPEGHSARLEHQGHLVQALVSRGRIADGRRLMRQVVEGERAALGAQNPLRARNLLRLAELELQVGAKVSAVTAAEEALDVGIPTELAQRAQGHWLLARALRGAAARTQAGLALESAPDTTEDGRQLRAEITAWLGRGG